MTCLSAVLDDCVREKRLHCLSLRLYEKLLATAEDANLASLVDTGPWPSIADVLCDAQIPNAAKVSVASEEGMA